MWRYSLVYTGPITPTHFVQSAEPSRVAVRQPSPQRTSLAVISKYTHTPLIPPPWSLSTVSFPLFFPAGNRPQRKSCKDFVALKALYTSLAVSKWIHSQSACIFFEFLFNSLQRRAVYVINISSCVPIFKSCQCGTFFILNQLETERQQFTVKGDVKMSFTLKLKYNNIIINK